MPARKKKLKMHTGKRAILFRCLPLLPNFMQHILCFSLSKRTAAAVRGKNPCNGFLMPFSCTHLYVYFAS